MRIVLVGEYNSSHSGLKKGLEAMGHEVTVVSLGDGFKERSADLNLKRKYNSGLGSLVKKVLFRLFKVDISSLATKKQFFAHKEVFTNNDIVQLINENAFHTQPRVEMQLLDYLFKNNRHVFLLCCGTDHISVKYAHDKKFRYSILTPYFEGRLSQKAAQPMLKYLWPEYRALHEFIFEHIKGVIASDLDYHIPYEKHPKYLGMIPNPIDTQKLAPIPLNTNGVIKIFHGINRDNYYKKGNDIFEKALEIVKQNCGSTVSVTTVESLPYKEYITLFDDAHIVLDQVFAFDQGFNALEAMAKGKVVFTGAEKEWLEYYDLQEDTVAINALPDAPAIAAKLEWLVNNPDKIIEISKNARAFIETHHDHMQVAGRYFDAWMAAINGQKPSESATQ